LQDEEDRQYEVKRSPSELSGLTKRTTLARGGEDQQSQDLTVRNSGDDDLSQYLEPLLRVQPGDLIPLDQSQLNAALTEGTLVVAGVKLWNALHSEQWRHREAAA